MKRIVTVLFAAFLCLTLSLAAFADTELPDPLPPENDPPVSASTGNETETPPDNSISPCEADEKEDNF